MITKEKKYKKLLMRLKDFQTQPASVKEIAGGLLMRFGSLASNINENDKKKIKNKTKVLSSLQKIARRRTN